MNESENQNSGISRRDLLKGAAAAGMAFTVGAQFPNLKASAAPGNNKITEENAKPGTRDWQLTKTRQLPGNINPHLKNGRCPWIEGYCSANSVRAGEKLQIMVSTNPASPFKLEIFRTGYYNGDGGRLMRTYDRLEGITQTDPPIGENYVRECRWAPSVEFEIPEDWLSGVYLGKLTEETTGIQSYVIFIVRDDRPCDFLFQCSDMTWSAYNRWPHNFSIYTKHEGSGTSVPSGHVSFDRPYALFTHPVNKHTMSGGAGEFLSWEFPLSFWMEQQGYDVSYISNIDTHSDPEGLLRTKGFISVGHDEYWSLEMYDNVMKARDAGVSLAFLSANAVLCVSPLSPSETGTPNRITFRGGWFFGEGPLPEMMHARNQVKGSSYKSVRGPDGALLMGAKTPVVFNGAGDWTCTKPEHWLFEGTGMKAGDSVKGLVGWEMHADPVMDLPGMQVIAEGPTMAGKNKGKYTATIYDGPKGNIVFNCATIWWANGISSPPGHKNPARHGVTQQGVDERVQKITHNLFQRMIAKDA